MAPGGAILVLALVLAPLAVGAGSAPASPIFAAGVEVVPFTADDVGGATEIESGDLNGDGLADVVVTRITYPPAHITHPVGIFLADGHGGFVDGSSMWDGPPARTEWGRQIIIADFNGDHRNDIFVADTGYDAEPFPGHQNALALSTPQGKLVDATANLPAESGYSHSAAAADINGDGSIDLYVGNECCGDAGPEFLINDGTGHFTRRPATEVYGYSYLRALLVDLNGDGSPDLVLGANTQTPSSRVLLNDGTGHFHDTPTPSFPPKPDYFGPTGILISLASLDVNGDGRPDLIAGYTSDNPFYVGRRLQVLVDNGNGTFRDETAQRLPQQDAGPGWPYAIRVADFNHDGHLDFAVDVNHYPVEQTGIYLDDGSGVYHEAPFVPDAQLFTVVDANNDGFPDIFSTLSGGGGGPEKHYLQLQLVAPTAPLGVHAVATRDGIRVTWRAVAGATGYEVWRAAGRAPSSRIDVLRSTAFLDRQAKRGITYTYTVRAVNDAGTGPFGSAAAKKRKV